ncbi:hypothetical protein BHE74_00031763 [Ensete ventricosum]|nr:hypothetical protein BHE74_00031763 [Ensete ventricosum]
MVSIYLSIFKLEGPTNRKLIVSLHRMPPYHYRKFRLSGRKLRASPSWGAWMPMPMPHYKVKKVDAAMDVLQSPRVLSKLPSSGGVTRSLSFPITTMFPASHQIIPPHRLRFLFQSVGMAVPPERVVQEIGKSLARPRLSKDALVKLLKVTLDSMNRGSTLNPSHSCAAFSAP